jgi:hypothetical protein
MFVVIWEPKRAPGGGHQLALELGKAEYIARSISRSQPHMEVRVETAEEHSAAAVRERVQRRRPQARAVQF